MNRSKPTVAFIMVTYNRADLLRKILQYILEFQWKFSEFMIIDNGSEDNTAIVLQEFKESLDLSILSQSENIGHGAGLAIGMDHIKIINPKLEYIVFLEDDSIPKVGYLEFLLEKIQHSNYTMISSAGSLVGLGKRKKLNPTSSEILSADFALFDGAIARFQDLLQVGFPVRDWFMMFDDFEYCYRIRKAGYKLGVVGNPHLDIFHEGWGGGVSHSHQWRSYYQSRNFVHFVRQHFTWFTFFDALILNSKRLLGGVFSKNGGMQVTKLRLLGFRAGLLGKTGKSLDLKTLKEVRG